MLHMTEQIKKNSTGLIRLVLLRMDKERTNMTNLNFREIFSFAAIVIFIASDQDIYSSILLMCASAYMIVDLVPKLWKMRKSSE